MDLVPVGSAAGYAVGHVPGIAGYRKAGKGNGAIFTERIGIKQHFRLSVETLFNIENRLILEAVVLEKEVVIPLPERNAKFRIVPDLFEPFADLLPVWNLGQVSVGYCILLNDPGLGFS